MVENQTFVPCDLKGGTGVHIKTNVLVCSKDKDVLNQIMGMNFCTGKKLELIPIKKVKEYLKTNEIDDYDFVEVDSIEDFIEGCEFSL